MADHGDALPPFRLACTVGILTFNSAPVLERLLDATVDFAETIICDGGSTDSTVGLALSRGCRVLRQGPDFQDASGRLRDFSGAMNQLVQASTQPWFLKVDSDEVPSEEFAAELARLLPGAEDFDAFEVPLLYVVGSRVVADATTYPIRQVRLFKTGTGIAYAHDVHERLELGNRTVGRCDNAILLPQWPIRVLIPRWWHYLLVEAEQLRGRTLLDRWRLGARSHGRAIKYLAWRYTKVLRSGLKPRLPIRYEALRVAYRAVAVLVLLLLPMFDRFRRT